MRAADFVQFVLLAAVLNTWGCAVSGAPPASLGTWAVHSLDGRNALAEWQHADSPAGLKAGLYVRAADIYGFPAHNRGDGPPFCKLTGFSSQLDNLEFDSKGRMIVTDYAASSVSVYTAPTKTRACGKILGTFTDPYGQPSDAASFDAVSGRIFVLSADRVAQCSLRTGCKSYALATMVDVPAGIVLAKNGDCWVSGDEVSGPGVLYYLRSCNTEGELTSGFSEGPDNYGGIDIDKHGNIVSIFTDPPRYRPALYVYSGCKPACTLVSGPTPLLGDGRFGHLNEDSTEFAIADTESGFVDVYTYAPTSLKFEYAFKNSLTSVYAAAYNPRAQQ